jgi:prolyl 4-hydroxylase
MASSTPKLSTIITWLLYFVPVYIFVLDPLLRPYFPDSSPSLLWGQGQDGHILEEWDTAPSTLHLTDDSFISPDDGVPVNCPGEAEGYRVHLLSQAPLVLYIENFVSAAEADHLVDIRYFHFPLSNKKNPLHQQTQTQIKMMNTKANTSNLPV